MKREHHGTGIGQRLRNHACVSRFAVLAFGVLTLAPSIGAGAPLSGIVVDAAGKPIAGAAVFSSGEAPERTRTTTDDQGRFQITGDSGRKTILFVTAPGFRFHGQVVAASAGQAMLRLTRRGEPPTRVLKTLAPVLSQEEERALARRLLAPYAEQAMAKGGKTPPIRGVATFGRLEPARVLEFIAQKGFDTPAQNDLLRLAIARGLAEDNPDEAIDIVESIQDPQLRANGFRFVSAALPPNETARKGNLLSKALLHAKAISMAWPRLILLGQVAGQLFELGETDRATKILREGQTIAGGLSDVRYDAFARGAFAQELALIDLPAALALLDGIKDPSSRDRYLLNIAHKLAGRDPAGAERVLKRTRPPSSRDIWMSRIVYTMAPRDRDRAERLAATVERPLQRAYALGMMAHALATADRQAARRLLDEAFATLGREAASRQPNRRALYTAAEVAAALLPAAEQIDPALVDEHLWQALSFHVPGVDQDAALALLVSRYDRDAAHLLFDPIAEQFRELVLGKANVQVLTAAAVVLEPRQAVERIEALPDSPDLLETRPKNHARMVAVQYLLLRGEERWKAAVRSLGLWAIGTADIE